ncbi:hypothetical protein G7074_18100 [Pedobacter sp. HDW13]|uniref:hypothetical protein n=1 Tax=Pedobacter sp. HDW13 TaxID=2714940 RepID=UPI001409B214|nr:hypothetical protein [Pedobacter sp. HDW13]QIL41008.1 hypothetical protein G7074_18100 [Pedobacter sp. HDW13]
MKTNKFLLIVLTMIFVACKKEQNSTLFGTWLSHDHAWQFTIKSLNGIGDNSFKVHGIMQDSLTWRSDPNIYKFQILRVNPKTLTLKYNSDTLYFIRLNN